jgi:hypothetical protein
MVVDKIKVWRPDKLYQKIGTSLHCITAIESSGSIYALSVMLLPTERTLSFALVPFIMRNIDLNGLSKFSKYVTIAFSFHIEHIC